MHLRMPWVATLSFSYMVVLSMTRGGYHPPPESQQAAQALQPESAIHSSSAATVHSSDTTAIHSSSVAAVHSSGAAAIHSSSAAAVYSSSAAALWPPWNRAAPGAALQASSSAPAAATVVASVAEPIAKGAFNRA